MTGNLTEQHRRKRSDLSEAIDRVPGLRDRLSYDRRRRAERKGDAMRASLSAHLEARAQRTVSDAAEYGKAAEALRVKRGSELAVDAEGDAEATARKLGLTDGELAVLRKVMGASARATDALETPLERAQRAAAESCRLA